MNHSVNNMSVKMGAVWAMIAAVAGMLGSYYSTQSAVAEKISSQSSEIYKDISIDRQRITAVETDLKTIKDSQMETRRDVKEILNRIK